MKVAFDWKAQKNRAAGIEGGADKILHFKDAFHGRSGYTLSVTNTDPTKTRDFPKFDWPRISSPYIDFPMDEEAVAAKEAQACAEIEAAFAADPHGIAAILIEPIQCEGGDHHFRPEFFARLREYADRLRGAPHLRRGADGPRLHRHHVGLRADRRHARTSSPSERRRRCAAS